ncbi:hypothetical protein PMZ80_008740 [Knufia obscura]|uniref:Wax synthase domain-containing protein n=1 Tax=Knufia obscura TaxID=1635080 RepID=A0ABR0RFP4_9EURO|nr:hypothetical protein PMZ80_008740 [Knufia obscura]
MADLNSLKPLIPIAYWLILNLNTGLALATPLSYRIYTLPAILLPAYASFRTINYLTFPAGLSAIYGYIVLIGLFHFTSPLYIKKWTVRSDRDKDDKSHSNSLWCRFARLPWKKIYRIVCNPRLINITQDDVEGLREDQKLTSTRRPVSKRTLYRCAIGWLIHVFVMPSIFPSAFVPFRPDEFAPTHQVFFRRLLSLVSSGTVNPPNIRETLLRAVFTVYSFWGTLLILDTTVQVFMAPFWIYVARVSEHRDWPDLNGSPLEAYTLGRFWSRFWHRLHVPGYLDFSRVLIDLLPRKIRENKFIRTTLTQFLFFLFSGTVHMLVSLQLGDTCAYITDIWFYMASFGGLFLEGLVLKYFNGKPQSKSSAELEKEKAQEASGKKPSTQSYKHVSVAWRCIGYIWVFGFFFWAVPKFNYPKVQCAIEAEIVRQRRAQAMASLMFGGRKAGST